MLHIGLIVLGCLILLAVPGSFLSCYVCLPDVVGNENSQALAIEWRANISRTWEKRTESSFGDCSKMAKTDLYQIRCNTNDSLTTCVEVNNGLWHARTCGRLPKANDTFTGCYNSRANHEQVTKTCICKKPDLCNSANTNNTHWVLMTIAMSLTVKYYQGYYQGINWM